MAEIEAAIARLEQAVARLEAAYGVDGPGGEASNRRLREVVGELVARVDRAVAKIARVLGEGG